MHRQLHLPDTAPSAAASSSQSFMVSGGGLRRLTAAQERHRSLATLVAGAALYRPAGAWASRTSAPAAPRRKCHLVRPVTRRGRRGGQWCAARVAWPSAVEPAAARPARTGHRSDADGCWFGGTLPTPAGRAVVAVAATASNEGGSSKSRTL